MQFINLKSIREDSPGEKWLALFDEYWASYKAWFLSEGHQARPGYVSSRRHLAASMPELMPIYDQLVDLVGGGDLEARFLTLHNPPAFLPGCSQAIWTRGEPALIRNYDYSPNLFEAVLLYSNWLRPVIAMSDCMWGVVDGINDAGLAVALAFGGRKVTGDGFGIPLILRYILETCDDTAAAVEVLQTIPSHMAYNVSIVDASGAHAVVFLSPDNPPIVSEQVVCANHQQKIDWEDYARASATRERQDFLLDVLDDEDETLERFVHRFMNAPLVSNQMGTRLRHAVYVPLFHAAGQRRSVLAARQASASDLRRLPRRNPRHHVPNGEFVREVTTPHYFSAEERSYLPTRQCG